MIITTHFGGSVFYVLQLYHCQARLYSGEKIERVYYFHFFDKILLCNCF